MNALIASPQRGFAIVRALNIKILIANHIPEHRAHLIKSQTRHPVSPVSSQTDDAVVGNVWMKDRRLPQQIGHHSRIRRAKFNNHFVLFNNRNPAVAIATNPRTVESKPVASRRFASCFETENGTFSIQFCHRTKVSFQSSLSWRFSHERFNKKESRLTPQKFFVFQALFIQLQFQDTQ